jgi:hypothetical protein
MHVPQWLKPGFWGIVVGALGIMIMGFAWGDGSWAAPLSAWPQTVRTAP